MSLPGTESPIGFDLTRKRAMMNRGNDGLSSLLLADLATMAVSAMHRDLYGREFSVAICSERWPVPSQ